VADVAVIQFQDDAGPGLLEPWALQRGVVLRLVRPDRGGALPSAPAAVVVLGSETSANDEHVPFTAPLLEWTADVLAARTPVLGICFGAQVMARALGAPITRLSAPEIGWVTVSPQNGAGVTPGPWMAWHEDGIGAHPAMRVVATNDRGIQAYRAGAGQLGVQFHPEVTPEIVAAWSRVDGAGRELAAAGTDMQALARETTRCAPVAAPAATALFDGWAREAGLLSA